MSWELLMGEETKSYENIELLGQTNPEASAPSAYFTYVKGCIPYCHFFGGFGGLESQVPLREHQ